MKGIFRRILLTTLVATTMYAGACFPLIPIMSGTAHAEVVTSDYAAYFTFENNFTDQSTTQTTATPSGNPSFADGRIGKSLWLNSTSQVRQFVNLGKPSQLQFGTSSFTIAFWVKSPGVSSDPPVISNKNWASGSNTGYVLALKDDKSLLWNYKTAVGNRADARIPSVADGKWHHIVVSHDRATGRADFYKDGSPVALTSVSGAPIYQGIASSIDISARTGTIDSGLSTMIGNDGTGAYAEAPNFNLHIDDLQIIKRAVTSSEVSSMFSSAPPEVVSDKFNGTLSLNGAEHAVQGGEFRVNVDLRTPQMSVAVDRVDLELAYDSNLFEYVSASKALSVDTSTPGVLKLRIAGGKVYSQGNVLDYATSRISELRFKTKAAAGQGKIKVNAAEFYSGSTKLVKEAYTAIDESIQIHAKSDIDTNKDGFITVGDLTAGANLSDTVKSQIANSVEYKPYKRVLVIGIDGGGASITPNAPYWETASSQKTTVGSRLNIPNIRKIVEQGAVSYTAKTTLPSSSSPNWGAMIAGVGFDKHKINNDDSAQFYYAENSAYPSVFKKLREALPNRKLAGFSTWSNIIDGHIEPSVGVEVGTGGDEQDAAALANYITSGKAYDTSLMFIQLDDMDHAGHTYGFYTTKYYEQLTLTDKNVGTIVDALTQANLADDTLVVLLPDHGGGTENANGTLGSSTSHGQDSPLATTIFFAAKGKTVENNGNQEKVIQGGATKDLAQTILSALGVQTTIGDSKVIPNMFVEQKDQNRANVGTLKLTKVTAKGTGETKGYELSVNGLPAQAQAADIVLNTDQLSVTSVQPLQPGVQVLRSDSTNGKTHIVLTASNGIQPDAPIVKLVVEGVTAASSAALSQAVMADAQGRETLPNFAAGTKEDDGTPPVTGLATSLSGTATVQSGAEYKVAFGLQNVTNSVYAQDVTVQYDPAAFDFVSAKPAKDTLSIVEKKNDGVGHLRLIVASQGAASGISGTQPVIEFVFKAKETTVAKNVTFAINGATVANDAGVESSAAVSSLPVQVLPQVIGKPGDMNNDGKYSIGDLAMIAANYGKTSASPDWSKIAIGDTDHNNVIDIDDLAWIANKILN